ncbi:hypothetical protein HDK77DRAFT_290733 [Phyllosticta capitalensis]|uniref:Ketoreductase domain-containing protein n=1 Tax=Phyllosticta capitalensis TaxID=121624 RepID=A0ABR1YGS1_9PEZI
MQIRGRLFLISGGASGLGRATAQDLHAHGAFVSVLDLQREAGMELASQLGPERFRFYETDITNSDSIAAAVKGSVEWAKEQQVPLGGVLAAAGTGNAALIINKKNEPVPLSEFDYILKLNLRGTVDLIRQVVPHMTNNAPFGPDSERGVIIMVSSSTAFEGQMGHSAYAASKGAILSMTLPLAREFGRFGIRVMSIAPAWFETKMTARLNESARKNLAKGFEFPKRPGKPEDFALLVRQIVENGMLNGEVIRLDGATRIPSKM